jgi:hypothetical protein
MSHIFSTAHLFRMPGMFDDIEYWWSHATPNDFGLLAITIVVSAWFVTKYYME